MRAHTSTDSRERVVELDGLQGVLIAALPDESYEARHTLSRWTSQPAGSPSLALNAKSVGNCLWKEPVDCLPGAELTVERIRHTDGANLGAKTAANTFVEVDIARPVMDGHPKIT